MITGWVILSKNSGQIRSIQGAIMWHSKYSAEKELKRDCKRCDTNFEKELNCYDIVEYKALKFEKSTGIKRIDIDKNKK